MHQVRKGSTRGSTRPTANLLLRRARELRGWSQQRVAEAVGTNKVMVSRWEGGVTSPSPHFRAQLCELFGRTAEDLGFLTAGEHTEQQIAEADTLLRLWHVPIPRNPCFTGREAILARLHSALRGARQTCLPQALCGMGGVGKTQTALEYAYRYRDQYQAVLWVRADTHDLLLADLAALAPLLGVASPVDADRYQVVQAVKHWLQVHSGWLLVLDNVDALALLAQVLPTAHAGRVLLTIRSPVTGTSAQPIVLESMVPHEGALFLLRRAKLLPPEAPLADAAEGHQTSAMAVSTLLGGLPLALDQVGAYVEETDCSLTDYLALYNARRAYLLDRRGTTVARDHPASVRTTLALAIEQVEQAMPAAVDLLRLCAMLYPEAIPEELFGAGAAEMGPLLGPVAADPLSLDEALVILRRFALVQRDPTSKTLSLHRLVQAVLLDRMDETTHRLWAERVVRAINRALPTISSATWFQFRRYLPQALAGCTLVTYWKLQGQEAARLLDQTGVYLREQALYQEAEELLKQAWSLKKGMVGRFHPETARSLHHLAELYLARGYYWRAEILYQAALALQEQTLGTTHVELAQTLCDLATLYRYQSRYGQALPLYQRALQIQEAALGPDHPDVAQTLNGTAQLVMHQGEHRQAEALYERARAIVSHTLGPEHPHMGILLNNLGLLYEAQGQYGRAELLYRQAAELKERTLGASHPHFATSLHNLAAVQFKQGQVEDAAQNYQQAAEIFEQTLGSEHPNTAHCLNSLALVYCRQNKYAEAERLYRAALSVRQRVLGPQHPSTATTLHDLARCYHDQRRFAQAQSRYHQALAIRIETLGPQHPQTLHTRHHLVQLALDLGQGEQAEAMGQEVLRLREVVFGTDDPELAESLDLLAQVYRKQGRSAEAESLARRAQLIHAGRVEAEEAVLAFPATRSPTPTSSMPNHGQAGHN